MKINHLRDTVAGKPMDVKFTESFYTPPEQPLSYPSVKDGISLDSGFAQNTQNITAGQLPRYNKG